MTDPDHDLPDEPLDSESLENLKAPADASDTPPMEERIGARRRWSWNPVTDTGASRTSEEQAGNRSSFQFDLGSALARFGGDEVPHQQPSPAPTDEPTTPEPPLLAPAEPSSDTDGLEPIDMRSGPAAEPSVSAPEQSAQPMPLEPIDMRSDPAAHPSDSAPQRSAQPMPFEPIEFDHETPPDFGDEPLPRRSRASTPPVTPTPDLRQQQPEPEIYQPRPSRPTNPQPSVFGGEAATPMLPGTANEPAPVLPDTRPIAAARSAAAVPPTSGALPTLPVANPAAAPAVTAPIETAPSTPDINALRSAQLRANRQQQKGKVFGRSLLAFMVIAGLIAGALIFGRSYLFTTEWDAALTPIVDDIQESTGIEFDHTIPLVVQPADEYAKGLLDSTLGTDWTSSVPAWRALGLASGDVTEGSVATVLAQRSSAYYDPIADAVFQAEGAEPEQVQSDLQVALVAAHQQQLATTASDVVETSQIGVAGVSTQQSIARSAADAFTIRRTVDAAFGAGPEPITETDLPIPIGYELAAVDRLGEAILTAAGADPTVLSPGAGYPDAIYGVLGDNPVNASSAPLKAGEQPLADALALGVDDWSLVWGSRLPRTTVDRLAGLVTADSYRPIERSGATCFVAVFQSATEAEGTSLYGSMLLWAQRGPAGSQALATQLGPNRVQLEACDPGPGTPIVPDAGTVDFLIERQLDRLVG